jgi:hypothetical protein
VNLHPHEFNRPSPQEPTHTFNISIFKEKDKKELGGKAHLVLVSVNCPLTGSNTVLNNTPFINPIFTNIVGILLLILASTISAIQIADGGAVNACKLIISNVVSGSNDIILTV